MPASPEGSEARMTRTEALRLATGYSWGHQDASHVPTCKLHGAQTGCVQFAARFADAEEDYANGKRDFMPSVQSAYRHWQLSGGRRIDGA